MLGGHQPKFYAIAALALVAVAPPRAGSAGVTVALPPGWHSTTPVQDRVTNPLARLVVASGPIHARLTGRCHVQVSDYVFPAHEVAIVVVEWTPKNMAGMGIGKGPGRPKRFTAANLPVRPHTIECWAGAGGSAQWAERGHTFGAYVLLGRRAPAALAARARAVLDTLRVSRR